jgi:hypothetical protein
MNGLKPAGSGTAALAFVMIFGYVTRSDETEPALLTVAATASRNHGVPLRIAGHPGMVEVADTPEIM